MRSSDPALLVAIAVLVAACGGAAQTPGAMPKQDMPAAPPTPAATSTQPVDSGATGPLLPPPGTPSTMEASKQERELANEFQSAEASALSAGKDCALACRAMRSMQHAAARLCSIAQSEEEKEVCRRAQVRVRVARDRVRASCGQCAGGPSLEPDAPIDES